MSDTEITRVIQIDDKTIHLHIHLTEEEARRLLLPHIASAIALELTRRQRRIRDITSNGTSTEGAWL